MIKSRKEKLKRFLSVAMAFNMIGIAEVPTVALAADMGTAGETKEASAETISIAAEGISRILSIEDDEEFLNELKKICTDSTGQTSVETNYENLLASAKETADSAEAAGVEPNELAKAILSADSRVQRIKQKLRNTQEAENKAVEKASLEKAKEVYANGLNEMSKCMKEAGDNEEAIEKCNVSDEAREAKAVIDAADIQVNESANTQNVRNVIEPTSAPKKSKHSVWARGDDGLWHETVTYKDVEDGDKTDGKDSEPKQENTAPAENNIESATPAVDTPPAKAPAKAPAKVTPKNEQKEITCPDGTVKAEGDKCCAKDTPVYDADKDNCVAAEEQEVYASDKKGKILKALGGLGAGIALYNILKPHTDGRDISSKDPRNRPIHYSFNYLTANDGIHYFPLNSVDDIKFKLSGVDIDKINPIATYRVQLPIKGKDGKIKAYTTKEKTLPLGEVITVLPKNLNGSQYYKELAEYGEVVRAEAKDVLLTGNGGYRPYHMIVSIYDKEKPDKAIAEYAIPFDFVSAETQITANPDKDMKPVEISAQTHSQYNTDGVIKSATFKNNVCTITLDGSVMNQTVNEESGDGEFTVNSDRFDESGCNKLSKSAGQELMFSGLAASDDGTGVLVDSWKTSDAHVSPNVGLKTADFNIGMKNKVKYANQKITLNIQGCNEDGSDLGFSAWTNGETIVTDDFAVNDAYYSKNNAEAINRKCQGNPKLKKIIQEGSQIIVFDKAHPEGYTAWQAGDLSKLTAVGSYLGKVEESTEQTENASTNLNLDKGVISIISAVKGIAPTSVVQGAKSIKDSAKNKFYDIVFGKGEDYREAYTDVRRSVIDRVGEQHKGAGLGPNQAR